MHPFFALNRLSSYLDGDLPRRERLEVERVLSRHPELEAELLNVQNAVRILGQVGPSRAPRRLVPEVLQAVDDRRGSPFQGPARTRNILLFLGVATVIATGLAAWMRPGNDVTTDATAGVTAPEDDFLLDDDLATDEAPAAAALVPAIEPVAEDTDAPDDARPPNAIDIDDLPPDPPSELEARPAASASIRPALTGSDGSDMEAFVPSWDKEPVHHEEGSPSLLQVAVYRVYANRADVLQDLHELAQANGTLMVDSLGQPMPVRPLAGGEDFASVHLTLPGENMESFLGQLARLGLAVEISAPESGAPQQELLLEVMYKP